MTAHNTASVTLPDSFARYVNMYSGTRRPSLYKYERATRPKPAPAHAVVGTLCRCDECWSRMRQIAEGVS